MGTGAPEMIETNPNRGRARARRLGAECAARGARPRPRRADAAARPPLRSRSGDRRGRGGDAARAVDRTRERRDAARRTRAPRPALQCASTAVVHQGSRPRAARRRLGRRDGRDGRRACGRLVARRDARASPFPIWPTRTRAAYHAGAAMASNYLVTLRAAAGSLLEAAGAPPEALDPLIRGVIETRASS